MWAACFCLVATGCGYHTTAQSTQLPDSVKTIAIPSFVNQTQTYRIEQQLTGAVVREMTTRTHYHVLNDADESADTRGETVASRIVSMKVSLTDRQGKVLFENPSYVFHEQYEVSRELSSFFEEDTAAMGRLSRDFARTLVSSILEGF